MPHTATPRTATERALSARRRSFALGVAAGETRQDLETRHGLTAAETRRWLGDAEIALLVLVWRPILLLERHGLAAMTRFVQEQLLAALRGAHGVEIPLGRLLLVLLGVTFVSLSTVASDLLAVSARKSIPCQRGFQPFLWLCRRLVQEVASIVERVSLARLRHERPVEVAAYVRAFVALAATDGEPVHRHSPRASAIGIGWALAGEVVDGVVAPTDRRGREARRRRRWSSTPPWPELSPIGGAANP